MIAMEEMKERLKALLVDERERAFVYVRQIYGQRCVSCTAKKECFANKWPSYRSCEDLALAYTAGLSVALFEIELQEQYQKG